MRRALLRGTAAAALALAAAALLGTVRGEAGVAPREFVVVALGDSYGSGEGAPEVDGQFAYSSATGRWQGTAETWTAPAASNSAARRCHRSPLSGFGQAVSLVRRAFSASNVTVTFRSFACTGAGVRFAIDPLTGQPMAAPKGGGALLPYVGQPAERNGAAPFAPQVTQARSFLGAAGKRADAVLLSLGGNDFGFAHIIFLCAVTEYLANANSTASNAAACQTSPLTQALVARATTPTAVTAAQAVLPEGTLRRCAFLTRAAVVARTCTPTLRASYDLLGAALSGTTPQTFVRCSGVQEAAAEALQPFAPVGTTRNVLGVQCRKQAANSVQAPLGTWVRTEATYPALAAPGTAGGLAPAGRVYITSYPDPLEDENGNLCDRRPADDRATRKLVLSESQFMRTTVRPTLVQAVQSAAGRNGWSFVTLGSAARHGGCADAANRFFNANIDSLRKQGEDVDSIPHAPGAPAEPALSGGFVHPNATGYGALYARQVAGRLRTQICTRFSLSPCPALP